MNTSETPRGLGDRGIGWQAAGFALVALVSVVILELYSGSRFWLYEGFRTAVVQIYWALVVPLGALFDWGRKMFETGRAIREAKLKQIRDEGLQEGRNVGRQEGRQETIELFRTVLEESGVSLPPDVAERLYDEHNRNGS
ncbi:MAG: hypothetical protein F4Y49_03665 [Dehalococcoidia bacterium]|nr:hypothetical protein [Dehalococcoidia bacterium]